MVLCPHENIGHFDYEMIEASTTGSNNLTLHNSSTINIEPQQKQKMAMPKGPELSRTKLKLDKAKLKAKEAEVNKQGLQDLQAQLSEQSQDKSKDFEAHKGSRSMGACLWRSCKDSTDFSGERAKKIA